MLANVKQLGEDTEDFRRMAATELCVGRWIWTSGKITYGHSVKWSRQQINTAPELYLWKEDGSGVVVVQPGFYQVTASFFTHPFPTPSTHPLHQVTASFFTGRGSAIRLCLNDEPIISSGDSVHTRMVMRRTVNAMKVTGLTITECLMLPQNAKLCVKFDGRSEEHTF